MPRLPQPGADAGNWGDILNEYLRTSIANDGTLKAGTVSAAQLKPNSVTSAAIANGAVTSTALADGAVGTTKLVDGSVTSTKLADSAVEEAKLSTAVQIKLNTVSSAVQTALDNKVNTSSVGVANGIASLGNDGTLLESQVPIRLSEEGLGSAIGAVVAPGASTPGRTSVITTVDLGTSARRVMGTERERISAVLRAPSGQAMVVASGALDSTTDPGAGYVSVPAGSEVLITDALPVWAYLAVAGNVVVMKEMSA